MAGLLQVVVAGAGIIGLTVARELARAGARVTVVDPRPPASEASWAAAGMLSPSSDVHPPGAFRDLCLAARNLYPEYVAELERETSRPVGLRAHGAIVASMHGSVQEALREPEMIWRPALFYPEDMSVDNRLLTRALVESCRSRGVHFLTAAARAVEPGAAILESGERIAGNAIINAAGSWAAQIQAPGVSIQVRPVKGQMAAVRPQGWTLRCIVRDEHIYLVPRDDGRILLGSTMEEAGYDKTVDPQVIRGFLEAGGRLVPKVRNAPLVETWAGLRPATPSGLPLIGPTSLPGCYLATGHLRNGILLAPLTARLLAETILTGKVPKLLRPFRP